MKLLAGLLLVLTLALTSCNREESEPAGRGGDTASERAAERTEKQPDAPGASTGESDGGRAGEGGTAPDAAPGTAVPDAGTPRFSTQGLVRRIPEDVVIGELEDRLDGPAPVLAAVEELFRELAAGRIPVELLASDVRADLEQRLEYMAERADVAEEVRIGALVRLSEDAYRAPVVAFGKRSGRTNGEIYVAETDGSWYISDILVDFTRIDEDGERPIFEPGSEGPTLLSF